MGLRSHRQRQGRALASRRLVSGPSGHRRDCLVHRFVIEQWRERVDQPPGAADENGDDAVESARLAVAAGSPGGTPVELLQKYHDRTLSFHIKDRTSPMHCSLTTPFGEGDVQIKEILDAVVKNKWKMIPTIELEYPVPADSDKVKEARKCLDFCLLRACEQDGLAGGRIYDAHIADVARAARATVVVTDNRRHFLTALRHGLRVETPSEFLAQLKARHRRT